MSQGTAAIVANSNLVRKIYFPRETLLVSIVLAAGLDLAIAGVIFGVMMGYYHIPVPVTVLWVPVLLAVQTLFALAVVCFTSAIHVTLRDIGHGIPLLLQLWMFATPVAYPLSVVPRGSPDLPAQTMTPIITATGGDRRRRLPSRARNRQRDHLLSSRSGTFLQRAEGTFADVTNGYEHEDWTAVSISI